MNEVSVLTEKLHNDIAKLQDVLLAIDYLRDVGRLAETASSTEHEDLSHYAERVLGGLYAVLDVLSTYGLELLESVQVQIERLTTEITGRLTHEANIR